MLAPVADAKIEHIVASHGRDRALLIPILQAVQGELGYLPETALLHIARHLRLPLAEVFGVVTFYAQFRLTPRGENIIRVCRGTACHVRGGATVRKAVEQMLGVPDGMTTSDLKFTYETVACIGACALAPTMVINDDTYGEMTPEKAKLILEEHRK